MTWQNWARNVRCAPAMVAAPTTLDDLVAAVRQARDQGLSIRACGTGHGMTSLVATDGAIIDTRGLQRILSIDGDRVRVEAGVRMRRLVEAAWECGLTLEGGTIFDGLCVGGVVATGSHGSSLAGGTLSGRVVAMTLVRADGEVVNVDEHDLDTLRAARISLGLLGVVYAITFRAEPATMMHVEAHEVPIKRALSRLPDVARQHDHVSVYHFPYTSTLRIYTADRVAAPLMPARSKAGSKAYEALLNRVISPLVMATARTFPRATPTLMTLGRAVVPRARPHTTRSVDAFHYIWRVPRFWDLEVTVDLAHAADAYALVLERLQRAKKDGRYPINMAVHQRFIGADDAYLSSTLGRDSACIECVTDPNTPGAEAFLRALERDLGQALAARPHWGKLFYDLSSYHAQAASQLAAFEAVRARFDPQGTFLTPWLQHAIGHDAQRAQVA